MTEIQKLTEMITGKDLDERLSDIYVSAERISWEKKRLTQALKRFAELFGEAEPVEIYSAPGRSEICGNHTDHQNGRVLAASISDDAIAVVSKTDAQKIRVFDER